MNGIHEMFFMEIIKLHDFFPGCYSVGVTSSVLKCINAAFLSLSLTDLSSKFIKVQSKSQLNEVHLNSLKSNQNHNLTKCRTIQDKTYSKEIRLVRPELKS